VPRQVKKDFSDIILPSQLHNRVRSLAATAANTKLHGAPYRHMLFYGRWTDWEKWQLPYRQPWRGRGRLGRIAPPVVNL